MTLNSRARAAAMPGRSFYRLVIAESLVMALLFVLQFHMALPEEDGQWPLSILSFLNLAAAGGLAIFAGFIHEGETAVKRLLKATGAVFIASPFLQILLPDTVIDYQDWAALGSWILSFVMISSILMREKASPTIQALFIAGLTVQAGVMLGDFGVDDFFRPDRSADLMDWTYVTGTSLSVLAYLLGFYLFLIQSAAHIPGYDNIVLQLHKQSYQGIGRFISIAVDNASFALWKVRHPGTTFAEYYAGSIARRIERGGSHRTLGRFRYLSDVVRESSEQGRRGVRQFNVLRDLGLRPDHICIEYGCGSLRIGQHLIGHLKPRHYRGLDIVDTFFREGLAMLSPAAAAKEPVLRVINDQSLREAREAEADFIFSIAVVKHIPPGEIDTFLKRITGLMTPSTILAIQFETGENGRRKGAKNWTYNREFLCERLRAHQPSARIRPPVPQTNRKEFLVVDGFDANAPTA